MPGRILYFTDKFGVSQGYMPAFTKMVNKCKIPRSAFSITDIYKLVESPLKKKANETTWRYNPEKLPELRRAFEMRVRVLKPSVIVVSDPALLGVVNGGDHASATLEKMRGGVYFYEGIPVVIVYPITAINQRVDSREKVNEDGEADKQNPYKVKDGSTILTWDWQKVGRYYNGNQKVLPSFRYSVTRTRADLESARDYLVNCTLIAVDIETGNYPPGITCVGYTGLNRNGSCHTFIIPFYDESKLSGCFWDSEDDHLAAIQTVATINRSNVPKALHNGSYDASYFIRDLLGLNRFTWDTMAMWWSKYMELKKSLDFVSSVLIDSYQYWKDDIKGSEEEKIPGAGMEKYWRYCGLDTYHTLWICVYMQVMLSNDKAMRWAYQDAMYRVFSGLGMSMRGLAVDFERRKYHREQLVKDRDMQEARIRFMLGEPEFNIGSPDHKKWMLYELFGLRPRTDRGRFVAADKLDSSAKDGGPSAGKIPLKLAKSEHPFFARIINTLDAAMEPRTQLQNIFGTPDPTASYGVRGGHFLPTKRFLYAMNPVGTETTRYSAKKSNFWCGGQPQNIRGDYKDWIVADEDCVILDVDYSQSDDVFIAYESQDPDKIAVVESGADAHAVNGELFFNIPYDRIVEAKKNKERWCVHPIEGVRQNSKRASHGTNFQMAGMTLYVTMGREAVVACAKVLGFEDAHHWNQDQLVHLCERLMAKYRKKYKRLNKKEWYAEVAKELKDTGKIVNCFGISRTFLGDWSENGTQREATAYFGQSATSGNMNRVQAEIDHGFIPATFRDGANPDRYEKPLKMTTQSHGFKFHLQVHDNFLSQLTLSHPRWKEAAHNLLHVMDRPVIIHGREVRIRAEADLGLRWGKNMLSWDGDVSKLDSLVAKLKFG